MKQILRGLLAAAVCTGLIFTAACGDSENNAPRATAMGRYIETEITAPEGILGFMKLLPDGKVNIRASIDLGGDYKTVIYQTEDFQTWGQLPELPQYEGYLNHSAYDAEGEHCFTTIDYETISEDEYNMINRLYRELPGGGLEEVAVDWYMAPGNDYYITADGLWILDNGDFIIKQDLDKKAVQYGRDGSFKRAYDSGYSDPVTISGNKIYILEIETANMRVYDGETEQLLDEVPFENYTRLSTLFPGQNGAVYMQNDFGLYRLQEEGSVWEKIIDGELNSMSMPNFYLSEFIETADGSFYCIASDGYYDYRLLRYHYDPDVATTPEHELVVYMLEDNETIRQAAGIFQKQNPSTQINIQVATEDSSTTRNDLLRALNTELLGGKGPDILILDGMNMESYISKGTLVDISDVVSEAVSGREMIETVLNTYAQDGKLYAVPAKFQMPIMTVPGSDAATLATLEGLAQFAQEHPEKSIIGDLRPENLMATFLPTSASAWIQDGVIDTQKLAEFLEIMKIIADSGQSHHSSETEYRSGGSEAFHYAYGRSHTLPYYTRGIGDMMTINIVMEMQEGSAMIHMPGQQEKTYIPTAVAGVNVNSNSQEVAKEFVKVLLSDEVQNNSRSSGYPVSVSALDELAADQLEGMMFGFSSTEFEGEDLVGEPPTAQQQQILAQLAKEVKNPATADEALTDMIAEAALDYFTGSKDLSQTIKDVEEATKLYLAE